MSVINYNYAANNAANSISRNERLMDKTMAKLSSGLEIGVGSNDPGRLSTYMALKANAATSRIGIGSINNAIAELKVVESTGMHLANLLSKMTELALKSAQADVNQPDREALDAEFGGHLLDFVRITTDTVYNGTSSMNGGAKTVSTGGVTNITYTVDDFRINASAASGAGIATGAVTVGTINSAGGSTSGLSTIVAAATAIVPATLQETINTAATAALTVAKLGTMIPQFAGAVAKVGGLISRLEYAGDAQAGRAVAFESAASTVGDTDYAVETARLASAQVISQAATAILAQANARSSTVLTLLK